MSYVQHKLCAYLPCSCRMRCEYGLGEDTTLYSYDAGISHYTLRYKQELLHNKVVLLRHIRIKNCIFDSSLQRFRFSLCWVSMMQNTCNVVHVTISLRSPFYHGNIGRDFKRQTNCQRLKSRVNLLCWDFSPSLFFSLFCSILPQGQTNSLNIYWCLTLASDSLFC